MAGRPAYERQSYLEDIRRLQARGLTADAIARHLQISRATLYRILAAARASSSASGGGR
jgi:DNA invertase Pin-like site-specific DNA recombinase